MSNVVKLMARCDGYDSWLQGVDERLSMLIDTRAASVVENDEELNATMEFLFRRILIR